MLEASYRKLQEQFNVEHGVCHLSRAVNFGPNSDYPVHRWFHFKEGFAANLFALAKIDTNSLKRPEGIFVDPFCGSGTSLLCGDLQHEWAGRSIGIEVNPFLAFVAKTKLDWRLYDPERIRVLSKEILAESLRMEIEPDEWPSLSTLSNERMFHRQRVSALVDAINRIKEVELPYRNPLLLGVSVVAEGVSNYRKTGRALRVIHSKAERARRADLKVERELADTWASYASDLVELGGRRRGETGKRDILVGDGRSMEAVDGLGVRRGEVTLITYSPPYLNHIDYTEVYKVELWLLGFLRNQSAMKELRARTVRSHASVQTPPGKPCLSPAAEDAINIASEMVASAGDSWHQQFPQVAASYLADLQLALNNQFRYLRPGGRSLCIIGNSAHGAKGSRVPIAVDLLVADIAKAVGFQVEKIQIARLLAKRDQLNEYLRESILWFRRPEGD